MNRISIIATGVLLTLQTVAQNKSEGIKNFSLKEAIDYGITHNVSNLNASLDIDASRYKKKEITGMGLPQISSSFDVKDYEKLPTQLLPGQFFGGAPGTFIPVQFGVKYNATGAIQAVRLFLIVIILLPYNPQSRFWNCQKKIICAHKLKQKPQLLKPIIQLW